MILNKETTLFLAMIAALGNDVYTDCLHPNDNTATVWLNPQDLMHIISDHGTTIEKINLNDCLIKEEI